MERGTQLLDIMNAVSARLDHAPVFSKSVEVLDELQAFIALDPLLASLNKQYLDARAARVQACREYGAEDGMTEMAVMVEDSAWCALQTRYMEVRADRPLMVQAQALMDESRREAEEREAQEKTRDALKLIDQMEMLLRMREYQAEKEKERKSRDNWWLLLMLMLHDRTGMFRAFHPSHTFNQLAA